MPIHHQQMPPFSTLLAFEAVARLGSFTSAAQELRVSQSAISQKVRELEAWMGTDLVLRTRPSLTLTTNGLKIADSVRSGVTTITRSLETARRSSLRANQVVLATTNTFALYWLGSRIETFYAAHSDIELSLVTSDRECTDSLSDFDLGVTFATAVPSDYESTLLFHTEVVAVASPKYLDKRPGGLEPAQWQDDILLHLAPDPWLEWPDWLKLVALSDDLNLRASYYSTYITLMQAVLAGRGIGLGWRALIDPILQDRAIVQIGNRAAKSAGAYYLISKSPIDQATPQGVQALYRWFLGFARSGA